MDKSILEKLNVVFIRILYTHLCRLQAVSIRSLRGGTQQGMLEGTLAEEVESPVEVGEEKCHHHRHHHPQHLFAE